MIKYNELVFQLKSRRESVYDYATQGPEWIEDSLCLEAAEAIESLKATIDLALKSCDEERFNVYELLSKPPQSHAALSIKNAIIANIKLRNKNMTINIAPEKTEESSLVESLKIIKLQIKSIESRLRELELRSICGD